MDKNVNINKSGGISIFSLLTIIFVILKAFGVISFTWFQCFIPLIIGLSLSLIIIIIATILIVLNQQLKNFGKLFPKFFRK